MLWIPMIATLILSILTGAIPVTAQGSGTLALDPSAVAWNVIDEPWMPPTSNKFDVNVTITNVTDVIAIVVSAHWNASVLDLTGVVMGDFLDDPSSGGVFTPGPTIDHAAGNLKEYAMTQLPTYVPKTYTDPDWGLVATLKFKFVGTPPSAGETITTTITLVNDPAAGMATRWKDVGATGPFPGGMYNFAVLGTCEFTYVAPGVAPVAIFTWEPENPLVDETVTFNASESYDPDGGGSIVSWDWTFGDTNTGTGEITTHAYTAAGTYTVTLTVTDDDDLTDSAEAPIEVTEAVPPAAGADLVKWKARPERHHFDVSAELGKGRDEINTLYALVRNLDVESSTDVKVVFTVYRAADMFRLGTLNVTDTLTPGLDKVLEAPFDTTDPTWQYTGTKIVYKVEATAYYDDGTGWVQIEGAKVKWLRFTVVP